MKFEGAYLSDGWVDSTQIWNRRCPTLRELEFSTNCLLPSDKRNLITAKVMGLIFTVQYRFNPTGTFRHTTVHTFVNIDNHVLVTCYNMIGCVCICVVNLLLCNFEVSS